VLSRRTEIIEKEAAATSKSNSNIKKPLKSGNIQTKLPLHTHAD